MMQISTSRKTQALRVVAACLAAACSILILFSGGIQAAEQPITRDQFAALLVESADIEGEGRAAEILVEKRILQGYPGGDLRLEQPITRVEAIAMIARSLGLSNEIKAPETADAPLSPNHWGYNLYAWLERQGALAQDSGVIGQYLTEAEAKALLSGVFVADAEALELIEKSNQAVLEKQASGIRSSGSSQMEIIPRKGLVQELPASMNMEMTFQQEILPEGIHQTNAMTMMDPENPGEQLNLATELYWIKGTMVQKLTDPNTGEATWLKYPEELTPDLETIMKKQQTQPIPEGMEEYFHYQLLGKQQVNDEEVYAIAFYGRVDDLQQFVGDALRQFEGNMPMPESGESLEVIEAMSYWGIQYIGVEDLLPRSIDYHMVMLYVDELGGEPLPIEAMRMKMKIDEFEYDENLSIELPEEAKNAPVIENFPPEPVEAPEDAEE